MPLAGDPPVHPYRWALIIGLVLCSTALVWYGFTIGVLLPDISDDLGLRPAQEGWLSSSFYLGQLVLTLPVTAWLSRYPPLRTMALVYALTVVLLIVAAITPWFWGQVGIRFALAFSFVALNPVRTLIIAGWFRRSEVARVNGLFNGGFGLVQTIAFWSSGFLLSVLGGWRAVVWLLVALGAIAAVAWFFLMQHAPPPSTPPEPASSAQGGSMGRVLRRREVWFLCMIGIGGALTWSAYLTFWPSFAQDRLGLTDAATGVVLGCSALMIIPGSLAASWVVQRVGSRRLFLVVATLSQIPCFALWVLLDNTVALVVVGIFQGLSWIYFPIMLSVPFDIKGFNPRDIALATGMFFVANALALTLGPSVSGLLAEWVDMRTVLLGVALMPLVSVAGALLLPDPPSFVLPDAVDPDRALAPAS